MKYTRVLTIFLLLFVCNMATSQIKSDAYFKELADDMCDCAGDLLEKVKVLERLSEEGKTDELMLLYQEIEADANKMEVCMRDLESKYEDIDGNPDYEKRAEAALVKHCPLFAEAFKDDPGIFDDEEDTAEIEMTEPYNPEEEMTKEEMEEWINEMEVEATEPESVLSDQYFEDLGDELCGCSDGASELIKKFQKAEGKNDQKMMQSLFPQLQAKQASFDNCMKRLEAKHAHKETGSNYETRAMKVLDRKCPDFMYVMENINRFESYGMDKVEEDVVVEGEIEAVDPDYERFAQKTCDCIQGISATFKTYQAAEARGDQEAMNTSLAELKIKEAKMEVCLEKVESEFSYIEQDPEKANKAVNALMSSCPEFMEVMSMAMTDSNLGEGDDIMIPDDEIEDYPDVEVEEIRDVKPQAYYNDFADEVCECINAEKGLKSKFLKLKKKGNQEKLTAFRKDIETNYPSFATCLEKLEDEINEIDESQNAQEKVIETMRVRCPFFIELVGG